MIKHIDAELLRAEIKKRLKNVRDYMTGVGMKYKGPKYFKAQGKESAYDALLNVITSLQQKRSDVDLEKEAVQFCFDKRLNLTPYEAKTIARHFYELGKQEGQR